jgi:hypothetical protein
MSAIQLTIAEIIDLAGFAGLTLHQNSLPEGDDLEAEVVIAVCPEDGTKDEETGRRIFTKHVAYMADYPEEGCMPLGPELEPQQ